MNLLKEQRRFNAGVAIGAAVVAGVMGLLGTVLGVYLSKPTAPLTPPAATASTAPDHADGVQTETRRD